VNTIQPATKQQQQKLIINSHNKLTLTLRMEARQKPVKKWNFGKKTVTTTANFFIVAKTPANARKKKGLLFSLISYP
jgi:hypothetical protein